MDTTILYTIAILAFVVIATFGVVYAKKNNIFTSEDIKTVSSLLGLTVSVLNELNLKNEDQIIKISTLVLKSLDYAVVTMELKDKATIITTAKEYIYKLCEENSIELTDSRKAIVDSLLVLVFNNKYADNVLAS